MRSILFIREENSSLYGVSDANTPISLRLLGGKEPLAVSAYKRNRKLGFFPSFAVLLKDFEKTGDIFADETDAQYVIFPVNRGSAPEHSLISLLFYNEIILTGYGWAACTDDDEYEKTVKKAVALAEIGKIAVFNKMLCFNSSVFLQELEKHNPELFQLSRKIYENRRAGRYTNRFCGLFMEQFEETTVSDALLCKSDKTVYMPESGGIEYMDSYRKISETGRKDENGNTGINLDDTFGVAEFSGAKDNLVLLSDRDITLLGVEGLVVVDTGKKLVIAKKGADIDALVKNMDA